MIRADSSRQAIAAAVDIFLQNRSATEAELVEKIRNVVGHEDLAERLVEFVPLAFGRVLLTKWGVKLPNEFVRMMGPNEFSDKCPLLAEPLWKPALAYAREAEHRLSKEEFWSISSWSAETDAVSKAIAAGSKPQDLVGAPPILMRAAPLPAMPDKHWWQVWK